MNKTGGFSIHNSEKNSEECESSSLRSSILSSSIIAVGEDSKNAMQKPNASLVKNLSSLLFVLGVLERTELSFSSGISSISSNVRSKTKKKLIRHSTLRKLIAGTIRFTHQRTFRG